MTLQGSGGTRGAKEAARREIKSLIEQCAAEKRSHAPASKIVLGLNCGGSDSFSGITANPGVGRRLRHAGRAGRVCGAGGDHRNFRRRTPPGPPRPQPPGRRKTARLRPRLQKISEPVRGRQLRRQSLARQQRGEADQHPRKIAGRRRQGGNFRHERRGGLRRAHHRARLQLHEHARIRSAFAGRPARQVAAT